MKGFIATGQLRNKIQHGIDGRMSGKFAVKQNNMKGLTCLLSKPELDRHGQLQQHFAHGCYRPVNTDPP